MKIEYLYAIIEIYNEKSLKKAAANLDLSDKTLHKYLNCLEEEVGVALTIRNTRGVELTDEGYSFYLYANNVLNNLNSFRKTIVAYKKDFIIASEIKIFVSGIMACTTKLIEKYNLKFSFKELYREEIFKGLVDREFHIGIITMDNAILETLHHFNLEFKAIGKRHTYVIVNENHPLASQDEISLTDLSGYKRLLFEHPFDDYPSYHYELEEKYSLANGNIRVRDLGDMELILQNTINYYYLGRLIPHEANTLTGLKAIKIMELQDAVDVGYVYRAKEEIDPILQELIDKVKMELSDFE